MDMMKKEAQSREQEIQQIGMMFVYWFLII